MGVVRDRRVRSTWRVNTRFGTSEKDIAGFLDNGMTPSGDFAGGAMAEVIANTSLLGADDRAAIANYIASLPPMQGPPRPPKKN